MRGTAGGRNCFSAAWAEVKRARRRSATRRSLCGSMICFQLDAGIYDSRVCFSTPPLGGVLKHTLQRSLELLAIQRQQSINDAFSRVVSEDVAIPVSLTTL